jgi:single-stranded DNA-binding protein
MSDSHVTLTGIITDDPELKITGNGVPVASFRIAVTPECATARPGATGRPRSSASTPGATWASTSPTP